MFSAPDVSDKNRYIHAMKLNNLDYSHNFLNHNTLMNGASLRFEMSGQPNKFRGVGEKDAPFSLSTNNQNH